MGIVNCPECNKEISDKAKACPHCGYPIKRTHKKKEVCSNKLVILCLVVSLIVIAVVIAFVIFSKLGKADGLTKIEFRNLVYSLGVDEEIQTTLIIEPSGADRSKIEFSMADETIATVFDNGKVHGLKTGETEIIATSPSGLIAKSKIIVGPTTIMEQLGEKEFWVVNGIKRDSSNMKYYFGEIDSLRIDLVEFIDENGCLVNITVNNKKYTLLMMSDTIGGKKVFTIDWGNVKNIWLAERNDKDCNVDLMNKALTEG